ncbi:MAG: hypothetical protein DRN30_02190 [Thermoplasmata archaeon]|nr:MAG: hypothetical protein DRN30_02190 [Thermoplasmata archaeon]
MFKVVKIKEDVSRRWEGRLYWVFMRDLLKNRSCRAYVGDKFRNWKRWERIIRKWEEGEEVVLGGLVYKDEKRGIIDGDSLVFISNGRVG